MTKIYRCKAHDYAHVYAVCPACRHQYCADYWAHCPSCAERAARELQMDYTSVEFDGITYWVR